MSKEGWGGKRVNSGRKRKASKVRHLRPPVLLPRNPSEEIAIKWFMGLKPEKRLVIITEAANRKLVEIKAEELLDKLFAEKKELPNGQKNT